MLVTTRAVPRRPPVVAANGTCVHAPVAARRCHWLPPMASARRCSGRMTEPPPVLRAAQRRAARRRGSRRCCRHTQCWCLRRCSPRRPWSSPAPPHALQCWVPTPPRPTSVAAVVVVACVAPRTPVLVAYAAPLHSSCRSTPVAVKARPPRLPRPPRHTPCRRGGCVAGAGTTAPLSCRYAPCSRRCSS